MARPGPIICPELLRQGSFPLATHAYFLQYLYIFRKYLARPFVVSKYVLFLYDCMQYHMLFITCTVYNVSENYLFVFIHLV